MMVLIGGLVIGGILGVFVTMLTQAENACQHDAELEELANWRRLARDLPEAELELEELNGGHVQ